MSKWINRYVMLPIAHEWSAFPFCLRGLPIALLLEDDRHGGNRDVLLDGGHTASPIALGGHGVHRDQIRLLHPRRLDELIETREVESDPHKILGIPASSQVIQSYLYLIGSGLFFAFQTFITSDVTNGPDGLFFPATSNQKILQSQQF